MSKLERIKQVLKSLLVEFGEVSTDKGVVIFDGDELEAGMMVHGIDEEGNEVQLEDGDYRTEDKKVITIEGGRVVEIKDDEAEVSTDEPAAPEQSEEENAEETPNEEPNEEPSNDEPATDEKDALIEQLKEQIAALEQENTELKDRIKELEETPAAMSAEEAFQNMETEDNTPVGKLRKKGYILK